MVLGQVSECKSVRQARNFAPLEKYIGHSLKNVGPSQKTLRPTLCPKLVTGLVYGFKH